jgi:putative acetyltransferase
MTVTIRPEEEGDADAVFAVNEQAFDRADEARLVARLRREADPYIGLVAVRDARVLGHIGFSPVTIEGWSNPVAAIGLAPLAVSPPAQRQGIGAQLVRAGLAACRERGFVLVVVVGDPRYYGRFGFVAASTLRLRYEHAPAEAFQLLTLSPIAPQQPPGVVHYLPAFSTV